ncbi:MAG: DUF302 domain-containing protein [Candidatus Dormiibacterota bacterium]
MAHDDRTRGESDVVTKASPRSVPDTVARLEDVLSSGGVKVFDVIDQSAEARQVGLQLRDTVLVIFGNPTAGTPVMVASPLSALDLPLKVLVWADDGQTYVSYYDPTALALRHHLSSDLASHLASIHLLTDKLIAP